MPSAKYHGKNTKALLNSVAVGVKSYKVKHHVDNADTTNTESGGKRNFDGGLEHLEFTIEAEIGVNGTATPDNINMIAPGSAGIPITLLLDRNNTASAITMPVTAIDDVDVDAPVDAIVKITVTGKSNGAFTMPG